MNNDKSIFFRRLIILSAVLAACVGLPGCISGTGANPKVSSRAGAENVVARITPGASRDFILGLLGNPAEKIAGADGTEVWQWPYVETHDNIKLLIFLYASVDEEKTEKTRFVEFKDGVVTRTWCK